MSAIRSGFTLALAYSVLRHVGTLPDWLASLY